MQYSRLYAWLVDVEFCYLEKGLGGGMMWKIDNWVMLSFWQNHSPGLFSVILL